MRANSEGYRALRGRSHASCWELSAWDWDDRATQRSYLHGRLEPRTPGRFSAIRTVVPNRSPLSFYILLLDYAVCIPIELLLFFCIRSKKENKRTMSSSMPIPKRKLPHSVIPSSSSPSGSLSSSSGSSAYYSPPASSSSWKGKNKVPITGSPATASPQPESWLLSPRRPSLLGSSLSKSEYTVINLGHDEGLRLVSCVKSSQGWDWNQGE